MKKLKILLVLILFIAILLFIKQILKLHDKYITLRKYYNENTLIINGSISDKATVQNLYQIVKDVTEVMEKHHLPHWAEGGTLLGAIRHQGLIPWDDDADFQIMEEDVDKFRNLVVPELQNIGYHVDFNSRFFQVYHRKTIGLEFAGGHLDIFPMKKEQDLIFYANPSVRNEFKCDHSYKAIFPLKKYKFGNIEINGAKDPAIYLNNCFGGKNGDAWQKEAVIFNHKKTLKPIRVKLTDELRKPAEHPLPLQDRVQK